jgi:hypothetical protein
MGESLPLSVARLASKAHSDAGPARIVGANAGAASGRVADAVSVAVVARLWVAVLGAVERALAGAVLDAVVVRVLALVVGRFSVRVSDANATLRRGESVQGYGAKSGQGDTGRNVSGGQ